VGAADAATAALTGAHGVTPSCRERPRERDRHRGRPTGVTRAVGIGIGVGVRTARSLFTRRHLVHAPRRPVLTPEFVHTATPGVVLCIRSFLQPVHLMRAGHLPAPAGLVMRPCLPSCPVCRNRTDDLCDCACALPYISTGARASGSTTVRVSDAGHQQST
jgi:hypothetical protein